MGVITGADATEYLVRVVDGTSITDNSANFVQVVAFVE
jgi:hypothetical protein